MAECPLPKPNTRVRFPSSAPYSRRSPPDCGAFLRRQRGTWRPSSARSSAGRLPDCRPVPRPSGLGPRQGLENGKSPAGLPSAKRRPRPTCLPTARPTARPSRLGPRQGLENGKSPAGLPSANGGSAQPVCQAYPPACLTAWPLGHPLSCQRPFA